MGNGGVHRRTFRSKRKLFRVDEKLLKTGAVDVFLRKPISREGLELVLDQVQSLIVRRRT